MTIVPAILLGVLLLLEPVTITRPSSPAPLVGTLVTTTSQGMHVQLAETQAVVIVPWYELRDQAPGAYSATAMQAWKAHARVERGDAIAALPLYVSLGKDYLWQQGPQSMDVCDGLTRCLLSSGRRLQAVEPMLAWFEATGRPGAEEAAIPDQLDATMNIRRDLPPVFSEADAARLPRLPEDTGDRTRLIYAYYALVADEDGQRGSRLDEIERLKRSYRARDPGLVFLEQMCFAQAHPEVSVRRSAVDSLIRRTQTQNGTWVEVWARLALGATLIRDADEHERDRGVIELIHIIVRLSDVDPGLTLLAADIADRHLSATHRSRWGAQLKKDARRNLVGSHSPHGDAGEVAQ